MKRHIGKGGQNLFTIIILSLSVLLIISTFIYLKKAENGGVKSLLPQKSEKPSSRKNAIDNLWQINNIQEGIIELPNDNYIAICRVSATDFYLLGEDEQEAIEDAAARAIMSLSMPIQLITISELVDTRQAVADLENKQAMNEQIAHLRNQRIAYLEAIMQDKQSTVRQSYLVISTLTNKGRKHVFGEIQHQISILQNGLGGARMQIEQLDSNAVVDFLSSLCNPSAPRPSEILQGGTLTPFHIKEGS